MMTLDLLGLLDRQTGFPRPLLRSSIRACKYRNRSDLPWPRQIFAAAVARRRWDLAFDLTMALGRSVPAFAAHPHVPLAPAPGARPGPAPGTASYLP